MVRRNGNKRNIAIKAFVAIGFVALLVFGAQSGSFKSLNGRDLVDIAPASGGEGDATQKHRDLSNVSR